MAKKGTIGTKIVLEGVNEYNKSLKDIAAEEKLLQSEMKKTQAAFKGMEDSEEALRKKQAILTEQVELQRKKYEEHRKMVENSAKAQQEYAKRSEEVRSQLEKEEATLKQLQSSSEASEEAIKEQAEAVDKLRDELAKSEAGYESAGKKMQTYQTRCNEAETNMLGLERELDDTTKKLDSVGDEADESSGEIRKVGTAANETSGDISTFGDVLKANLASEVIIEGLKALASGIKNVASSAIEVGSSFEASMSQVAATMGITSQEIREGSQAYDLLAAAAKACGESTKYSATEAGEALNYLALAGYDAEKAAATLPKVLDLAAAGGMSLATASDLVTDSMAALGMETNELQNYIDEMAKASQKSNTSVQQLGEATLVCAGAVSSAGVDLETMNTALGVLANNGIKGAEGGTHLRNVLLSLAAPTENAAVQLKTLGVETVTSGGDLRSLEAILIDLNHAMSGMGTAEKTQAIKNIFNKTDIAAVNALLKSTTGEFGALYKEIENCSGAASNMAETMNDNLKGKVTILGSTLEALGISAYEVFDEDLKRGVETATNAVARLNKAVKEGDMNASLNKMSDALGDFIERGAELAEDLLPKVIDAATWCLDNFPTIAALVSGIVAANLAMNTIAPVIQMAQAAWIAYTTAEEGATAAQAAFNAVASANPIGILVAGIAALTAGMIAYSALADDSVKETSRLTEEQKKLAESAKNVSDSIKKAADSRKEDIQNIDIQKKHTTDLINELKSYQNSSGQVVRERERAKQIVEELNTLLPDLCLYYNEETISLSQSTEELQRNTEALWAQAEAAAYQEHMTEIMKERIEVETEMAKLQDEYTAAQERQTEAQMAYHDALDKLNSMENTMTEEYAEQLGLVTQLDWARQEEAKRCSEVCGPYDELQGRLNELDAEYEIVNGRIDDVNETMAEAEAAVESYAGTTDYQLSLTEEAYDDLLKAVGDSMRGQMSLWDEYEKAEEQHKETLLKNMADQVAGMQDWADDMKELAARGIDEGLLQSLAEMGPQGAGYVKAFLEMTDKELAEANRMYAEAMKLPTETAVEVAQTYEEVGLQANQYMKSGFEVSMRDVAEEVGSMFGEIGQNAVEGTTKGIEDSLQDVNDAGQDIGDELADGAETSLDSHSPSLRMKEIGINAVLGLINGIEEAAIEAEEASADTADLIAETFENRADDSIFYNFGRDAVDGFIDGMESRANAAARAARELAETITDTFRSKMKISSPSKVFEYFGEMTAEGFDEGFKSYLPKIENTMDSLTPQIEENTTSNANTYNNNSNITINVTGAEGQSVEELANAVEERLNDKLNSKEGIYR